MSENKRFLCISQSNGYKMGSETLRVSNFSPIMGFMASFDTQDWVKYWFLEPNKGLVIKYRRGGLAKSVSVETVFC